ncbi:MAG: tRNA (cytidine(34)-2'-O)-methyltransferase [Pseudomonadota bacterium]
MDIVLYQPEIPPNTGNIIRLSANMNMPLHLVKPYGFEINDTRLKRAGLDYRDLTHVTEHESWDACQQALPGRRWLALSARGTTGYADVHYHRDDLLLFGPETRGLPQALLETLPQETRLRIPMQPGARSLNLANAVAVVGYEALRQQSFTGLV